MGRLLPVPGTENGTGRSPCREDGRIGKTEEGRQSMTQALPAAGLIVPSTLAVLPQALTGMWAGI
ncbi:hypothetical protein GCM10009564_41670 [Streptomyces thermogriseus]|uniref:Uncharacterized protein n=1 Tax=Streptomyces thermogriseus TaxID=75292 RepID=A0ABN1T3V9_9ACTN